MRQSVPVLQQTELSKNKESVRYMNGSVYNEFFDVTNIVNATFLTTPATMGKNERLIFDMFKDSVTVNFVCYEKYDDVLAASGPLPNGVQRIKGDIWDVEDLQKFDVIVNDILVCTLEVPTLIDQINRFFTGREKPGIYSVELSRHGKRGDKVCETVIEEMIDACPSVRLIGAAPYACGPDNRPGPAGVLIYSNVDLPPVLKCIQKDLAESGRTVAGEWFAQDRAGRDLPTYYVEHINNRNG